MFDASAQAPVPSFFLYGEAPRDDGSRLLHVETIAFRSARYQWRIKPHLHRSLHQLLYVTEGKGTALGEGLAGSFRAPALVAVPAGVVHGFDFEPGTNGYVVSLTDDLIGDVVQREAGAVHLFASPLRHELGDDALRAADLARGFEMMAAEFTHALPGGMLAAEGLLIFVLARVLRLFDASAAPSDAGSNARRVIVARFRELIEAQFRDGWQLTDYAAALNLSTSSLRNASLRVAGQPPIRLVHARMLTEAKRLLTYTRMPVSEIAYECGFRDPAYFTRFFSRRVGTSPRGFRSAPERAD